MYDLVHEPSVSVAPNWSNRFVPHLYAKRYADVTFLSSSSVIVPAGRSKEFWISITPPAGLDVKALYAYGGYVVAKPRDSSLPSVKSVYYGVKGDMSTADVVQDATFTFNPVDKLPDGTSVFDPYRDSKANALLKLRYASRRVEAFYESSDGRRAGGYLASLSNVGSDWVKTLIPLADYTCDAKALEQNGGICAAGGNGHVAKKVSD
ncbi:hypothetical protein GQ42DRAFT_181578 [Ramicandelaber brevisporus]|nr:hypothetical protein GQ42DRAFT_181578 [Ramicandelaber brevisporus]